MGTVAIRSYERKDLPLNERLTSLAKRFPALKNATGVDPFDFETLLNYVLKCSAESSKQAGLLILHLSNSDTTIEKFDLIQAMKNWSEQDRQMFVNLLKIWVF